MGSEHPFSHKNLKFQWTIYSLMSSHTCPWPDPDSLLDTWHHCPHARRIKTSTCHFLKQLPPKQRLHGCPTLRRTSQASLPSPHNIPNHPWLHQHFGMIIQKPPLSFTTRIPFANSSQLRPITCKLSPPPLLYHNYRFAAWPGDPNPPISLPLVACIIINLFACACCPQLAAPCRHCCRLLSGAPLTLSAITFLWLLKNKRKVQNAPYAS